MIGVLRAEIARFVARKAIWVTLLAGVVLAALLSIPLVMAAQPPSSAQVEDAKRYYAQAKADWDVDGERMKQDCLAHSPEAEKKMCEQMVPPKESDFIPQPLSFATATKEAASSGAVLGGLIAIIAAATFWGAEYRHGTLATWLTFVPDRLQVWVGKFVAAMIGGAVLSLAPMVVLVTAGAASVAAFQGVGATFWPAEALAIVGRGVGLGALSAILGASLAVLFRQTTASVLVPLGYLIFSGMLGILARVPGFDDLPRWLPETNLSAYLRNGAEYWVEVTQVGAGGMTTEMVARQVSFAQGTTYVLVAVTALALASWLSFRKRDVA